jgi:hypothetical protein
MRVLNRVGPVLAPRWPSLDPDNIVRAAARAAKSDQFGDESFLDALPLFFDAIEREADLTWLGRVMCRQSLLSFLQNRFRFPDPPPQSATFDADPRIAKARTYFGHMDTMAPSLASIHEISADLPQECLPILGQTMLGPQLHVSFNVPSYQAWVDAQSHAPAYTYHRHFLEHLQSKHMGDRWVLKSPVHLRSLDALLAEYPDARIIFTHRDPAKIVPSLASLYYVVRGLASDSVDPCALGRQTTEWWADALDAAMAVRDKHSDKAAQFMDVQFEEIVADPVAVLGRAYERFDIPWSADIEGRMRSFLDDHPRGKHGSHSYEIEDFGMTLGQIRERFGRYCSTYDVQLVV